MKMTFLAAVLLTTSLVASDVRAGDEVKKDLVSIQGNWKLISVSVQGVMVPEATLKKVIKAGLAHSNGCLIEGDKFISKGDKIGTADTVVWTMRLNPTKKPKAVDLVHVAPDEGKTTPGIYSLEGDILKIYFPDPNAEGQKRPADFANKKGVMGYVLKRQKD